jgi:hypothetical protein
MITNFLNCKTVYKQKQMEGHGIRFTVRAIFGKDNQEVLSGVVKNSQSKFSFYSKSSQVYILVELSEEMYLFDDNGFLFHEKCV